MLDRKHTGNFSREAARPLTPGLGFDAIHYIWNHKTEAHTRKCRHKKGERVYFHRSYTQDTGSVTFSI